MTVKGTLARPPSTVGADHYQCIRCGIIKNRNGSTRRTRSNMCIDCLDVLGLSGRSEHARTARKRRRTA